MTYLRRTRRPHRRAFAALAALFALVEPAYGRAKELSASELPHCDAPLGSVAIDEPQVRWWGELGLSSPESLIRLYVARSNCFTVLDRSRALRLRGVESSLEGANALQPGANLAFQVVPADYYLVPDIARVGKKRGTSAKTAALGFIIAGPLGAWALSRPSSNEAEVVLSLVDARTTQQLYVSSGSARKTDKLLLGFQPDDFAGTASTYYRDGAGRVLAAAYIQAYADMVRFAQSRPSAEAASPPGAVKLRQNADLRSAPSPEAPARQLLADQQVFPTGKRDGIWWEVDDASGHRGWIIATALAAH